MSVYGRGARGWTPPPRRKPPPPPADYDFGPPEPLRTTPPIGVVIDLVQVNGVWMTPEDAKR